MIEENINKKTSKLRVLVAPLDWGLGHTTRCIPIIHALLNQEIEVLIGAEGPPATLLKNEFPLLPVLPLKGYKIRYGSHHFLLLRLLLQLPGILKTIRYEKRWLKKIVASEHIDVVISDNRFGLCHPAIRCIYITHQLYIETGNKLVDFLAKKIHYWYISKFNEVWVPDAKGVDNLAGKLSHPIQFPVVPVKYLGILSRFSFESQKKHIDLLIILSGPEPQRTNFENIIFKQLKALTISIVLVRGLPGNNKQLVKG
ncbi:MAG TPA: hypothetical protein VK498_12825, partial [Ferruginibacter sp.]|nr:hypothetical protein [Ferruginibacter sp.]